MKLIKDKVASLQGLICRL